MIGFRSPAGAKDFYSGPCVQTGFGSHPASYPMGTERGKARPGRDADHSPPSSAEVNPLKPKMNKESSEGKQKSRNKEKMLGEK
jgi:hypothetical protein